MRTGDVIPEPAIDARTGKLYVVWQDPRFNADPTEDQVVISSSTSGGVSGTWTAPTPVNDPRDLAAFTPAIKVLADGRVTLSYHVPRGQDRKDDVLPTQLVLEVGDGPERQLGDTFNMLAAPFAGFGFFTGDYQGMAVEGDTVYVLSTLTNCANARCAALQSFDANGNPIPSRAPNSTDVFAFRRSVG